MRERIRERWKEKRNEMWNKLVLKTDAERNPKNFWRQIGRMLGRRGKWVESLKNENGRELKTGEEIEAAFRARLERTFKISEEENEDFDEETEKEVKEWRNRTREKLRPKETIEYIDIPEITEEVVTGILKKPQDLPESPETSSYKRTQIYAKCTQRFSPHV